MFCKAGDRRKRKERSGKGSTLIFVFVFWYLPTYASAYVCMKWKEKGVDAYEHTANGLGRETEGESKGDLSLVTL